MDPCSPTHPPTHPPITPVNRTGALPVNPTCEFKGLAHIVRGMLIVAEAAARHAPCLVCLTRIRLGSLGSRAQVLQACAEAECDSLFDTKVGLSTWIASGCFKCKVQQNVGAHLHVESLVDALSSASAFAWSRRPGSQAI